MSSGYPPGPARSQSSITCAHAFAPDSNSGFIVLMEDSSGSVLLRCSTLHVLVCLCRPGPKDLSDRYVGEALITSERKGVLFYLGRQVRINRCVWIGSPFSPDKNR